MKQLTARYYNETMTIVIYNEQSKLVEFSFWDMYAWGFPALPYWEKTSFGYDLKFSSVLQ